MNCSDHILYIKNKISKLIGIIHKTHIFLDRNTLRNLYFTFIYTYLPASCKSAIISTLIKKQGLDSEILKNYRPVANLSFISKIIEKAIATQIHSHLINNDIVDNFQSAYKTGHSCETALLRVYNDIVTTIGRGNGAMLVLLDLSAAFDTIDHDNLFCILEKYVGICGNALKLIKSYFSNCCCLPTPMTLASGGSTMFPLVVHQPASPSIWPAVQSLRRGVSTKPGATMWCVCGCS